MVAPTSENEQPTALPPARGWQTLNLSFVTEPPPALAGLVYAVLAFLISVISVAGLWIGWQFVYQSFTIWPKDFEDTSRRLLAVGVIVAAPFAIWRIVVSHWQARAAQHQARAAARQADVAREEHFTTLFIAAVQQLGAMRELQDGERIRTEPNTEARLGAIYALERIAQDSERDHWPIMETLCAYVRKNAGPPAVLSAIARHRISSDRFARMSSEAETVVRPPVDVQAAITVIGRRSDNRIAHEQRMREASKDKAAARIDLRRTNLSGLTLAGNFDFALFEHSSLHFAEFDHTSLSHARLNWVDAAGAEVTDANMSDVSLVGAHWEGAELVRCTLDNAHGYAVRMSGAELLRSSAKNTRFMHGFFEGAKIVSSDVTDANFLGAELTGCSFRNSSLVRAAMTNAKAEALDLTGANCAGVLDLEQADVDSASGDWRTTLDDAVVRPASWLSEGVSPQEVTDYSVAWMRKRRVAIAGRQQEREDQAERDDVPF